MKSLFKKITKSEAGFTLAEIMVAAGLVGVLSLAVLQLTENMQKSTKKLHQDFNKNQLMNMLATNMMNSNACANSFVQNDGTLAQPLHFPDAGTVPPLYGNGINPQVNGIEAGVDREIRDKNNRVILSPGDVYGDNTEGAMVIETIRLNNYENNAAPWNNGAQTATLELKVSKRVAAQLEARGKTAAEADAAAKRTSLGQAFSYIRIPVKVKLNGAGEVESCYTEFESHLQTVCNTSFQGTHEELSSGKCKSVMIESVGSDPTDVNAARNAAITVAEGSLELVKDTASRETIVSNNDASIDMEGGLGIGTTRSTGDGNVNASGGVVIGAATAPTVGDIKALSGFVAGNTAVDPDNGDILAVGGASLGSVGANPQPGDLLVTSGVSAGGASANPDNGDFVGTGGLSVGPGTPNPDSGDILATSGIKAGTTGSAPYDGDVIARGGISVGVTGIRADPNTGWVDADAGMVIRTTMPANPTGMASAASSSVNELVPNIGWVRQQIARTLAPTPGDVSSIMSDIMDTAIGDSDSAAIILKRNICQNTRIRHANGAYATGSWISASNRCDFTTYNCSESGRCTHVYANFEMRAGRDIHAGRHLYVTSNAYANYIRSYGNMYANGDIDVDEVYARNRVCARGNCYTMFHSAICGGRSVMVGIRNGRIICANKW